MERLLAPPLAPGCPWSGFTPPNVNWCEEELCSWVVNPADTWSNAAYVLAGLWMWQAARGRARSDLALFGPAAVVVGVFSGIYHASYTYALQLFDFAGMYLFCCLVIALNAVRLGWITRARRLRFYLAGVVLFTAATPAVFETGVPIQGLVLLLILFAVGQEWALSRRAAAARVRYGAFFVALLLLGAGAAFSALDVSRTWCDPANHWLQGHALWHVLSASALLALFHFYAALPEAARAQ